ncbi:hypothetical protein QAD02_012430 [Eretmocerus hayati]|uniref:Uncharacterized protein n=1 Tax=Eretmocerus hayati TaxID=131215 RepID=A0ACC2NZQ0_9HYME|nr:hypothetical protein QAD02_012430 [Eretmocerus hayati]
MESKIAKEEDGNDCLTNEAMHFHDDEEESAYEGSCCSNISEKLFKSVPTERAASAMNQIPLYRFTVPLNEGKNRSVFTNNHLSNPKICDDPCLTLHDRMRCLSLDELNSKRNVIGKSNRKNMSFTNDQIMKIERDNEILLRKIMAQQKPRKVKIESVNSKASNSAINRRRLQQKIEEDNLVSFII